MVFTLIIVVTCFMLDGFELEDEYSSYISYDEICIYISKTI